MNSSLPGRVETYQDSPQSLRLDQQKVYSMPPGPTKRACYTASSMKGIRKYMDNETLNNADFKPEPYLESLERFLDSLLSDYIDDKDKEE